MEFQTREKRFLHFKSGGLGSQSWENEGKIKFKLKVRARTQLTIFVYIFFHIFTDL